MPSLFTAMTAGELAKDPKVYSINSSPFVLDFGQTIELVLNNYDSGRHPFHLHGHEFQAVIRSKQDEGPYVHNATFSQVPMRRDVFVVQPNGNFVIRWRSYNPGVSTVLLYLPHATNDEIDLALSLSHTVAHRLWTSRHNR